MNSKDAIISPRIVFMGTPDFAVPSLRALAAAGLKPIAVVTGPDRKRGRGQVLTPTPVKAAALELGIESILEPEDVKSDSFATDIRALQPDIMVVVAFRILPEAVFAASRLATFNLHGSLLPAWRGAAPINRAIMAGATETGVTTFFLRSKVDTGAIIMKRSMDIGPNETAGEVHDRMMIMGAQVVIETTRMIIDGEAKGQPQDDTLATPAPKIFREDCKVDWNRASEEVHNLIRAVSPIPGAVTKLEGRQVKLYRSRLSSGTASAGTIVAVEPDLIVACGNGAIELIELQAEGKQRLLVADFVRGMRLEVGQQFEDV